MKILFIAPLPPPTHGQSLASQVLLKRIEKFHDVRVVDTAKKKRPTNLWHYVSRSFEVLSFFVAVIGKKRSVDVIYFTISESVPGNIKDFMIYMLCYAKLDRMFIHMLGGAGMKTILEKKGILFRLNRFFISRVRGVIVEGQAQAKTFSLLRTGDSIHVVPNFAEDFLFVEEETVRNKFLNTQPIKILYLSNLIYGKGYEELADGYIGLEDDVKQKVQITFVGGFQSERHKKDFLDRIEGHPGLIYYGNFAAGEKKKALYLDSHIFCLPTYYPFEGQPISILEAYATGCAVVTTLHSGIPEVFSDGLNGFAVQKKSAASITEVINNLCQNPQHLVNIALQNRNTAHLKYRTLIYTSSLVRILGIGTDDQNGKPGLRTDQQIPEI